MILEPAYRPDSTPTARVKREYRMDIAAMLDAQAGRRASLDADVAKAAENSLVMRAMRSSPGWAET